MVRMSATDVARHFSAVVSRVGAGEEIEIVRNGALVAQLLAAIEPVPITEGVARVHAEMWAQLEATGSMIGAHDLWIGATAVAHGMALATTNQREFERVPGLTVLGL